jgi:hypothetical protein
MKYNIIEQHPFEFVLKINGNIICQRFFNIHNFNEDVIDSLEMKELLDSIVGMDNTGGWEMGIIPSFLKARSCEYLQFFEDNQHLSYKNKDAENINIWAKDDSYSFEIKIDGEVVGVSRFEANTFPPKIRYKVNLKHKTNIWGEKELNDKGLPTQLDILPRITKEIKKTFSQKSYTQEYMGYDLDYNTKLRAEYAEKYQTLNN